MRVSVLTPTIEGRDKQLDECEASVAAQTVPVEHLIWYDEPREGPGKSRNRLARMAKGDWLLPLDDDDTLDPDCVEVLLDQADADVVYPWCRVEGIDWSPNRLFRGETLLKYNYIPVTALIRKELFLQVDGFRDVPVEDWDLWKRLYAAGATFQCVDEVLWTYRVQPGSRNRWL